MEKIKTILGQLAGSASLIKELKNNPAVFSKKHGLTDAEAASLRISSILLTTKSRNPFAGTTTYTFTTGTTITGGQKQFRLEDLSKDQLVRYFERALTDKTFAKDARDFLEL